MAWHFDEANDDVQLTDHAALTLPDGDWTVAGLVKLDDNAGVSRQGVLCWGTLSAAPSMNVLFIEEDAAGDANKILVQTEDADADGMAFYSSTTPGTSRVWQHIALVRSGTTLTLYVDGVSVGSQVDATYNAVNVAENLYFGSRSTGDQRLGGDLAEWCKWNRALDIDELAGLAKLYSPLFYPGRVWHLEMIRPYQELVVPLTVTNNGSIAAPHPPVIYPFRLWGVVIPGGSGRPNPELSACAGLYNPFESVSPMAWRLLERRRHFQAATTTPQGGAVVYTPLSVRVGQHDFKRWTPVGSVVLWPLGTPPLGWIRCTGYELDRTVYAKLFKVLGTTFGAGDGATTFRVPDLTGDEPGDFIYIIKVDEPNWSIQQIAYGHGTVFG